MEGTNILQKSVLAEWTEGVQKAKDPKAKQILRKRLAKKYGLGINYVQGIIELGAAEGLTRTGGGEKQGGRTWEPVNPVEWLENHEGRISAIERRQDYLDEGVKKVLEEAKTLAIHIHQIGQIDKWVERGKPLEPKGPPPRLLKK